MPICATVAAVLAGDTTPADAVAHLMGRPAAVELHDLTRPDVTARAAGGADPTAARVHVPTMPRPAVTAASGPDAVLEHIGPRADLIVPLANGEPVSLLDAVEAHASALDGVRVHQMHAIHDRPVPARGVR